MAHSTKDIARLKRKKRIRARVSGTAMRPRLSVYRSNKHVFAQLVDDTKSQTLASASDLKEAKGTPMERAKKVGGEIATAAKAKNIEMAVFDRNGYRYHGCVKALADAAREAGLKF